MEVLIFILIMIGYIVDVLINRWLNKIMYQKDKDWDIVPMLWFIPIIPTAAWIVAIIDNFLKTNNSKINDWFVGKHWKK